MSSQEPADNSADRIDSAADSSRSAKDVGPRDGHAQLDAVARNRLATRTRRQVVQQTEGPLRPLKAEDLADATESYLVSEAAAVLISDYLIIEDTFIEGLQQKVRSHVDAGWRPHGDLLRRDEGAGAGGNPCGYWAQVMVK